MSFVVRPINRGDQREVERFRQIMGQCYNISDADLEARKDWFYKNAEQIRVLVEDGEVIAVLTLFDMNILVGEAELRMGGVAGVACPPENRRRGATAHLLQECLQEMHEDGVPISILYPFKYSFYRKYGWEWCGQLLQYTVPVEQLAPLLRAGGRCQRASQEDIPLLDDLYRKFVRGCAGPLVRHERHWQEELLSGRGNRRYAYLWLPAEDGAEEGPRTGSSGAEPGAGPKAQGYVIYELQGRDQLRVRELAYLSIDAYRGLWGFLANHDSQVKQVSIETRPDDPLRLVLPEPRFEAKVNPSFMCRLVDLRAALEARPFEADEGLGFALNVLDRQCPWNNGEFHLEIGRAEAKVEKGVRKSPADPLLHTDIQTLAQLYTGALAPTKAVWLGRLSPASKLPAGFLERMDAAFGNLKPYLNDFF